MTKPTEQEVANAIELQRPIEQPLARAEPSIESIIQSAVEAGRTGAELTELLAFARELRKDKAAAAFADAFSAFQRECPAIPRDKHAKIVSRKGTTFGYDYADVEAIMRTIQPVLTKYGLSVSFGDSTFTGQLITETAIVQHRDGHSRTASFTTTLDSESGMSPQQKYGAASTYAQRRALSKVLGIWTGDPDTDGNDPGGKPETIAGKQVTDLKSLLATPGLPDDTQAKMLAWLGVESLADIPDARFRQVYAMLLKKIAAIPKPTEPDEPGPDATPDEYVDHILPEDMPPADEDPQQPDRESAVYKSLLADVRKRFKAMRDDARTAWLKDIGCKATEIGSLDYNELLSAREAMP